MAARKKILFPKSLLEMKFMKKTKERIEKELQNTQDIEGLYSNVITNEMRHASGNYISESSFIFCEDLIDGRVSYNGMNPEIERLMELERKDDVDISEMQIDVPDEILSKQMNNLKKRKCTSSSGKSEIKRKKNKLY